MKRHTLAILALVAVSVGLESASAEGSDDEKPNIVVIFIDDMGFADRIIDNNPNAIERAAPWATERSFPVSAGRGCRSRRIARSISSGVTATVRST